MKERWMQEIESETMLKKKKMQQMDNAKVNWGKIKGVFFSNWY